MSFWNPQLKVFKEAVFNDASALGSKAYALI